MSEESQSPPVRGILLQVKQLDKLRSFYRDTLGLASPTLDSNHLVEFTLPDGFALILQQCEFACPETRGYVSWLLYTDDFDQTVANLEEKGLEPTHPPFELPSRRCATFHDPEGNPFTVVGRHG